MLNLHKNPAPPFGENVDFVYTDTVSEERKKEKTWDLINDQRPI